MLNRAFFFFQLFALIQPVNAALLERLGGLAYYDEDADLTWLADANAGGQIDWWDANAWAASLDVAGVTGWRLPDTLQPDTSCERVSSGGNAYVGYNCTGSEMGNLFYNVLGNTAGSLTNTGPFSNMQLSWYWSATETDFSTFSAWAFNMGDGDQDYLGRATFLYTWAVHDGDVEVIPVPAAVWLFTSGLIGLVGFARSKANA